MRLIFLGYWSLQDPLTTATVLPHLRLLQENADVEAILLITIERGTTSQLPPALVLPFAATKITFAPLLSRVGMPVLLNKIDDFRRFPRELIQQVAEFKPDFILARGAPAGALAYLVWQKTNLPFYVESFEPHSEYMRQAGVWRRYDPRYLFQRYWERQQKRYAQGLMPVAENYRRQLLAEGLPAGQVVTVPCSVDAEAFSFDVEARMRLRQQLGIRPAAVVGVYVGKFGGIYYDAEAFGLFRQVADYFGPDFYLLILTPQPAEELQQKLFAAGVDSSRVSIVFAPFSQVPNYLSAADFGFGLHRPTPYVSPIKVGEYWANGLPVLLTEGVGDDSGIIQQEGAGAVLNLSHPGSVAKALCQLHSILNDAAHRLRIRQLAIHYRSSNYASRAYKRLFAAYVVTQVFIF
ncbi:hypothetical protein A0257_08190 [Hymenobacter psoromatis]|nr:hypothetical protein A0257_08190 [Hymenobacter psoromatis]